MSRLKTGSSFIFSPDIHVRVRVALGQKPDAHLKLAFIYDALILLDSSNSKLKPFKS